MCIIIVKKTGISPPDESTVRTCWSANPSGAGIAVHSPGITDVRIRKGAMKLKDALELIKGINKEDSAIIHFRQATHGLVDAGNTHPFPVEGKIGMLRKTEALTECAVAHNGIFAGYDCKEDKYSDSQLYITKVLYPVRGYLINKEIRDLIEAGLGGNKLAMLFHDGTVDMLGQFIHDKASGLYFSNNGYQPHVFYHLDNYDSWSDHNYWYKRSLQKRGNNAPAVGKALIKTGAECAFCGTMIEVQYRKDVDSRVCSDCYSKIN